MKKESNNYKQSFNRIVLDVHRWFLDLENELPRSSDSKHVIDELGSPTDPNGMEQAVFVWSTSSARLINTTPV